ncbi:protein AHNAK2-like [Grus americana]|uniref:protein AHNAK2-like n=1 Tax=Grus americana TaxID=9117 RepID=UPI002408523F|nr:protein AHNAK2-like [Grus americana]
MLLSGSGRQLRPAEPPGDADADADAEDEDSVNEVAVEDIRPRPQGSSPVYEYSIEEEYLKLQEENKKYSTDKSKQSHPQETMEVTLKTEVEAGASGFSVTGGGNEGIFIKKVLKESPASKIFSLREGDQLLSATIFFDNIKYEDALKILQYSEPYRVQFSLKRKIAGKEELEYIQSAAQYKKERLSQQKELSESIPEETLHVSGKAIAEEDRETLIVSQRVGRSKRPKKDRLSWPKFQSIKNKKILGHRRSHSTSDAYEPAIQDISPTSTDTESQFQQEVPIKQKKGSQKKLKFPSIGFKMHRSKPETQDKQKKEIKTTLLSEREKIRKEDTSLENPEILTVEYTTSPAYEIKTEELHETLPKDLKDMKNGIPSQAKKSPEVEISVEKDKESTSKFTIPEAPAITTQISKPSLETTDLKESPTKQTPQPSSKSRKKKQKGKADKTEGESGINIDMMGHKAQGSIQVKGLEIGIAKAELHTKSDTVETGEKQAEDDTQILMIQKTKSGISMHKRKEPQTETTKPGSDIPHSVPEKTAEISSEDGRNLDLKPHMPDAESEASTWKIQIPTFKMTKTPKADQKISTEESTVEAVDTVKKEQTEDDGMPMSNKMLKMDTGMKTGEKDIEVKESKFRLPKLKLPTFTWATTKDEAGQTETQVSDREGKGPSVEDDAKPDIRVSTEGIQIPSAEIEIGIYKENIKDKHMRKLIELEQPSLRTLTVKTSSTEKHFEETDREILINKPAIEIKQDKFSISSKENEDISQTLTAEGEGPALALKADVPSAKAEGAGWKVEKPSLKMPKADIKAPKVDVSLPSVDVTLPKASVDLQAPEAALTLEGEAKAPEKEAAKTKDGKFKMPKFGMPSFGWSSSREAKGTVAADADVSLKEPQVTVPSGTAEVDVTLPAAEIQAPGVEVTVETAAGGDGEKGRFKMPDVKMPSVKLPKVKAPHVQVSLPKAEVSLPKAQAEVPEGEVAVQGPDAEGGLEVAAGKVEGGGMKIHMPKVKVPGVVFSKPTVKAPKLDADISLHKVDASLPEADLKAGTGDISIAAPDTKLPSVEGSLELQAPEIDLKVPSGEGSLDGAELEAAGLKGKFKLPKFDKPKFGVSPPKAEGLEVEVSLPAAEVELPSATVTAAGEGPALALKADVPGAKAEGAGWKVEKPSLKMPKADIKAPKVDVSLPSVDVTLPKASVDLQAPEAALTLEGEAKAPEKEAAKTKDGKFKMPKFGMPSFGWSSSREAKGTVAADADVSLKEPQVTVPSGTAEVDVTLPAAEIQAPGVEVTVETAAGGDGEKGRFKMPDVKMPSVKLPKVKAPHVQVSLPKAEVSLPKAQAEVPEGEVAVQGPDAEGGLEVAAGKVEGGGMKIHMPKVKVPGVVFSKPTVKAPKLDADISLHKVDASLPEADLKAGTGDISIAAPDTKLPSVEGSLELQAPEIDLKVPSGEGSLDGAEPEAAGLKGKFKLPKFDKPKFGVSPPKAEGLEVEVSLPAAEVELPSATVTAAGEGPALALKADVPGAKAEGAGWKVEKPSLKMPKADIKAPKVDVSLPSVDVTLPKASVDLQAPEAALTLEGEAKAPEKEAAKTKDGKFKMPKFGMPSFGWSSSREAKGTVAADADVSLKEPQVTVPSGTAEVDVTLPAAEIQAPGVEVTVETAARGDGEKGRFKMPDVKMPSVKLPKVKAPHVQVSLPKAEVSLPKAQAEVPEGEVAVQGPDAEGGLEVAAGKVEGGGMKIHMPKVKVPGVVFSKPTVKAPKLDADISLHKVDASLPEADLKAGTGDISIAAPDTKLPSVEGSLELQAPEIDLKVPSGEGSLDGAEPEAAGLKGKFKLPKFDKPKFGVSPPKAEGLEVEVSLPAAEVELPSATVTAAGEGPALALKADVPGAKAEGAGWKVEKPSLKMPKADIKAPKVDVNLPSVDVTLPKASVDLQAPEAALTLEGEAKAPEKEAAKTKDGKFKMPKFGMPSFGWSSSREAKGTVAADADVSLKEPQVTVPSGTAEVDVTLPAAEIQAPGVEVTVETAAGGDGEKGRFKMPDVKMPSVKLPKVKAPHVQVSLPKAEVSLPKAQAEVPEGEVAVQGPDAEGGLEVAAGKVEGGGMKIHMPKVKVPGVVFSKPTVKAPKLDADVSLHKVDASLPEADLKAGTGAISIAAPDTKLPSVEGSLELQAPEIDLKVPSGEGSLDGAELEAAGLKGKFKLPKFDKPKFGVSPPKAEGLEVEVSLPAAEVELPSATVTAAGKGPALALKADVPGAKAEGAGWKVEKPSLKMPKADIKAPKVDVSLPSVDVSLPSVDVTLPKASVDLQAPEAALTLEGEAKAPEKEAAKTKDGKFKMPKFGMPSFGWSSSREAKGTVAADADVSLKEPQVTVPSGTAEVDVTLPAAEIQAPGVEVTVETAAGGDGEKGRFKMPDVKMPSVKLPKVKAPHVQVSLPKAEVSLPKAQAEVPEGEVAVQGPDAEGGLEVAAGKVEGGGMKIHMPKVKVPGVVFSKPTVKAPKLDADISLHKVDASLPEADLKAGTGDISIAAPDTKLPSVEGSLELQAPEIDLKVPSGEGSLDGAELEAAGLKGKFKLPKFDKPKFGVSPPKAEGLEVEVSLPAAEVELPSATVTAAGEGPALALKADVPGAKAEGAGWKVEKPSLKMPKADIKAPKVDVSLPSVDVTLPKASVDLQAPEAALTLEGEAKAPEKEAAKTKDGKFKMPKFGMPSFGWSSSREAKGTVAADADVSLKEPQVTVPSGTAEVDVTLPAAEIQAPGVEVTVETAAGGDGEKGRFKMPDVKMPSVKLPKVKAPHVQVSLPKAEVSLPKAQAEVPEGEVAVQGPDAEGGLEVAAGKVEGGGMKIHMPKVKVPGVVFSKPTVKAPKLDADISLHKVDTSLPEADLKAGTGDISIAAPDTKLPSVEGSLELQAPEIDLKVPSGEGSLDGAELEAAGLKGKFKLPKFDKPKFGVSPPKAEGLEVEVSLPAAEVELPSATVTAAGEGPALALKADVPGAKAEGAGWKVEKPSLKMPKADIKAPKVDVSLPSVDVTLPKASVDLQAPEAALTLEGEAKAPEKEAAKTKDGKFKMPKFGMPSFGWSSSREAKGTVAADADVSLKEPQVTVPSGTAEVDVTLPAAEIQAPGVEVTVETAAGGDGEKGRFKMPDVKMPSVKLPKVKAPHVQVSLPKAEVSLPKAQAEVPEGEVAVQGPDAEGGLEVAAGKVEGGGMKIHMPKVKVPGVVFSKPTVKAPKLDADISLHKVDASLPEADLKAGTGDISIAAPDTKLPSVEGSLELQAPEIDLKVPSGEGSLDGAELEAAGLKGKFKLPKFDKPKFGVSPPKAEGLEVEVSLPAAEVELPSATVTAAGEGPALALKADVPGAKAEGAGWKVEKPSLKMPKADIKAPKVDVSLPSVDVTLPKASVDLQAPEAALTLEGEAKAPEKEAVKTKDGKFKMPKFGMPSFGWSSSREAKGTVAADADVSLKEPQVTVPSGTAEVDVTLPAAEIQAPGVEVTVETAAGGDGEKGRFKMPDVKMPSVKLPKVKAPHVQVSLPKAEVSLPKAQAEVPEGEVAVQGPDAEGGLEVAAGKVEGGGMKIHMPKVKVPGVVFSKPTVKAPKLDADISLHKVDASLPEADLKAGTGDISIAAPDTKLPSVEGSLELQAPEIDLKVPSGEGSLDGAELEAAGLKGKFKLPKFDKPKFGVSPPKAEGLEVEVSLPAAEVELPSATVTAAGEGPALALKADVPGAKAEGAGWKVEKPSLKMPKADIKAPKVDVSLPSVDVTLPKASVDLQAPEAALTLEGEAKAPEKEAVKTKDGKFKMPKFGMPSFGWSSSREAKGTVAADADVSLKEPQVTVPSGTAEVDVTLPAAEIQAPGVEVTVETAAGGDSEKGRFKMPDVKMPSVKLPKVKAPHVQVSLPKAEVSLPKAQAEVPEGEVAVQGPDAEGGLEVAAGKVEGGGMKIHMPKVKVPGVVFSKPTVKAPKLDADISLHKVDASLPEADLKAGTGDISIAAPDTKLPSVEGSLELQAPEIDLKVPSGEGSLDGAEPEAAGLKGKFKLPKFDKPKFGVSPPKAEGLEVEVSLPAAEVELPSATVTAAGEGPALALKADVPGAKAEGAGWKVEKPSLKMPKADIKAPKVDVSLPSVDVTLPKASVDLQAPEAALTLEGEAKAPEKEAAKTKDGKFKMPKFGMPSFGWSSSREAKGTVAADADVSLKEPQVTVPSGTAEVDVTLPAAEIQAPGVEVTVETAAGGDGEKGRFKMPDVKMPSVKLPKVKAPHVQVSLPKAEVSLPKAQAEVPEGEVAVQGPDAEGGLEVAAGKVEGGGMKIHMPKVKVPGVVFSKPTVKAPKLDADISLHKVDASLPEADLKAGTGDISIAAPDTKLPSVEGSLELQAPEIDLKVPSGEGSLDGAELEAAGLKGKFKLPKFDKPKFGVSPPKAEGLEVEVSLPAAEVELPSATVTAAGEGPALALKADVPGAKAEGAGWKVEKPSLKMPKADIKAPKVDVSLPSVDVTLPKASVDLQAPEAALTLEGEAKAPEKEAAKTKDGKFKMPKFGMPSFGWSSSREAKGTVAADADVSLKEPQVTVPSGTAEVDVTLPAAEIQAPGVEVTVETAAGGDGEKGRFKMPDVKMPSVKLPKVKAPHVQVSLPKAEVSLPKAQAEVPEGEVAVQGPDAEGGLEVAAGKVEGGGMKIHMPKVKVPGVVFSKPTVKAPKLDADISLHKVDASLPEADLKAGTGDISIAAPDTKLPSVEGSLELQAPEIDLKVPSGEGSLDGAELEAAGLKGKFKLPKFDKPKFGVSPPKAEGLEVEVSLPAAEVELPSATVTAAGEGPALALKADVPGAKAEGAGWKVEKPSLKMPKADIKAPKVDVSLPSVDVTLPKASVDLQAPEAALTLEGEAKAPEKEAAKTKDGKFKMPKFGMPSFGWSSSREAKGTVAADADVSLKEPQVTVPSGTAEVDVTLPAAEIQAPGVEVTVETAAGGDGEKGRFKMPDVKMPSVKLPKVKAPHVQVSLPKAEVSLPKAQAEVPEGEVAVQGPDAEGGLEVAAGKVEGGGMKIHMPKVKVPGVVFSKPTVKAPKLDADISLHKVDASLPEADLKAGTGDISIAAPDTKLPSVEGSLELQAPEIDLKVPSGEGSLDGAELEAAGLKGKFKLPKFDKPKFGVSPPKAEGLEVEVSLPAAEVELPSATVTAAGEGPALALKADVPGAKAEGAGWKVEKPSLKMPKADIKAPKVDVSLPSVDVTLPKASVDLQAPEAALTLEGEAKAPEKEAAKTKDGKFKMPKFGMPSFGWSSSREAKGTVAADADVSLKEPQVTVPSGTAEVDVTLPAAEIQAPGVEVTVETAAGGDGEKGRFKMPDVKMPSVKLPKVKAPHVQVSLPKAEVSLPKAQAEVPEGEVAVQGPDAEGGLEVAAGKVEGGGMKIHMPKVKVPGVVFSKPTVKAPKLDADVSLHKVDASLPEADLKAGTGDISIAAPDTKLPSVEGSLELQAPKIDLKVPSGEGSLDGAEPEAAGLKGKFKLPKFDKPKFGVSPPKAEGLEVEVSLPAAEVELPSATVTAAGEGPALALKADVPGAKAEGAGWKVEKPSLKMPKADIKAPKVDVSLPSVDVTLPKASVDLQAPEAALTLEGEAKAPEKEAAKTKDGKFKMPKFGMPSFGWSSSREAKGTVAADADVSLKEPQVTVPSGTAEVDVTLPAAEIQAPGVEVTVETAAGGDGEKGRFKMPDVKMPSVKLPKVKAPHVQVSLPKAEVSLPKAQAEVPEGEVAVQGPDAEGGLEVAAGKVEGSGMKIHMPKVKVPGVVFSKPTVKAPKLDADVSLHKVDASLPEADLKAGTGDISIAAPDTKLPSVEGSLELQAPEIDLKVPSGEGSLDSAEPEAAGLKGKFKLPKFDKPKFGVSPPKAEGLEVEVSLPAAEVELPSATVTAAGEGPALALKADVPGAKAEGAGWKVEKPSLKMPKADIKAPKVDVSLPSIDVTLPKASVDLQAPEAALTLEGEAKAPEKEAAKTKDGKFKMPKFGMPSFGWSSSREAKGTVAADADVSLKEPQVTVPSGTAEVNVTLPAAEIQAPSFQVVTSSSSGKEDEMCKAKTSLFRMPKVSLSKCSKSQAQSKYGFEVPVSETLCGSVTEETPAHLSGSVESKLLPDNMGDSGSKNTKFRIPSLGFSKVDIGSSKSAQDSLLPKGDITLTKYEINLAESESKLSSLAHENLSVTDFEILKDDGSVEQGSLKPGEKTPAAEIDVSDTEFTVKIPKFRKPKFGISWSKGKLSESDVGSKMETEISKGKMTSNLTDTDTEKPTQIPDAKLDIKMHKPSPEVVLDSPKCDVSLPSMQVTVPKLEVDIHGPDLESKAEQEVVSGEKDSEEKENKFKTSKFKLPSFHWSPKKEAIASSEVEAHLEEPTLSTLPGDTESELTFPTPENQYIHEEFDTSTEKDGEKGRNKKSQFSMPKISFPKMKGQKVHVPLPMLETDVCGPKEEKEGVSVGKSEKGSSGEGAGMGMEVPKVTVPALEFSKPEVKAPKIEMDISMPTGEVILPTCEEDDLTLKSAAANASLSTSDIKMITEGSLEVKIPDISVESTSSEIAVGDVEMKIEGPEGKPKMSKFQMPKFGIIHSKGKGPESEVSQSKSEVKVSQLKAMVEIADIAVEAPHLEVECGTGSEIYSPKVKMTKADNKAAEADAHLPSADISIPKPDSDIQDSDAALKIKGEIKQDGDGEEKEGHFKMPKFKLPSFSWSPKKEASVKADSGANLEDHKLGVMSGRIDTEVRGTLTDDQGTEPALDLDISAGKVEQKSPIKKPQFVMPKISLSKIKVPKSQTHSPKAEAGAAIPKTERECDASIQIPDIEKSHSERTEEGTQISIKLADVKIPTLEFSKIETGASQTDVGVSSAKVDAAQPPSEGSFQQVVLKLSSTDEDKIHKTGIKFPKGQASTELRSPETVKERSSVVDGRKMKLEGPEGKIKMPKFQKPKFGISLTKGKGPETEISSPKIEAELPQLKITNEIADIAVGVPASELTSNVSDPGVGVYVCTTKMPQVLTAGMEAPKVDISPQTVSKPMTEGAIESLEEKEIELKEEHEIKAEEVQTEEHQGWFKMPKFRIPAFGRTSLKEKKGDADVERSMEKIQAGILSAKVQTETSIPENTFSLPHAVAEITIGKEGIPKLGDSVKSSDVSLPKMEGDISLSPERTDSRVNIPKTETYADVVKHSAEGQKPHTSEFTVSSAELFKSYLTASEIDKDNSLTNRFPTCTLTVQEHKVKSQNIQVSKVESSTKLETSEIGCKPSSAEITLDATQEKIGVSLPKEELDIQDQEAVIKEGKIKDEMKIIGKDSEGSQLKRSTLERSTTKGSEDGAYVTAKLEDLKVEVPGVKMDVKIATVDPEMKPQVKSVEKDMSAEVKVQVEDREETSKIKTYKFKIPKFGVLHSEVKVFEDDINLPKSETDSISKPELGTAEMQFQKSEGSIGLKSSALDHSEMSARTTVDKSQGGPEVNIKIPKLKIPRFTFEALPTEAHVSMSKVVTDPKGSSTDIEVVQLQASSAVHEETPEALESGIQKAKSKILTLTEPDIKTAQMTTTIESSLSNAGQDIHWSYVEGQEVSEKVEPEHVAIERCEIYTTEILKESEILSSEVKTATLGFSLLKVKLPESHSNLEVLVQQPYSTEDVSVSKHKCADESFGVAAQSIGSAELKLSDKPHSETKESSGEVSLSKVKTFAIEVKPSSKLEESHPDKSPEGINAGPLSKDENAAEALEDEEEDITGEKEKTDSKRSPGRFKFWLPTIGFSSSGDETSTDSKTEVKKSVPEDVKPADTSDNETSKQTEKTGWFRFPKLGFTSPSKKAKAVDKEETGHKEGRISDEDSPSDKPDVFFDAQESLSPKETEGEKAETDGASSNVPVSRTIVTSSARTELILLEEEKDGQSNFPGDTTK